MPALTPSSLRRLACLGLQAVVITCALAGPTKTLAQEADTVAAEAKQLRDRAVDALTRKDSQMLFAVMDQYRELVPAGAQIPAGLFFAEADAARISGDPVRAERAFNDYFLVASPEGAAFNEAMRTYREFLASLPESIWPIVEGMTPVAGTPSSAAPSGATGPATSGPPLPRIAPFSLARRPVTRAQFAEFVAASGYQPSPAQNDSSSDCSPPTSSSAPVAAPEAGALENAAPGAEAPAAAPPGESAPAGAPVATAAAPGVGADDPITCIGWTDAVAYVDWLRQSTGIKFRLSESTEWEHATQTARAAGILTGSPPWEWVADCAVTSGIGVTPDSTIEANRDNCVQRVTLSDGAAAAGTPTPMNTRQSRPPLHRAPNLGFRLAL